MPRIPTWAATLLLTSIVLAGCTGADEPGDAGSPAGTPPGASPTATSTPSPSAEPSPATSPATSPDASPTPALGASCPNTELGVTIAHPEGWNTNEDDVLPACSVFDPEPFQLEENTEIPQELAVQLYGSDRQFATYADGGDEPGTRVLELRETTVEDRDAVAMLLEATEDAPLLEPGTRFYRWVIDLGVDEMTAVSTLLLVTYDEGEPPFQEKRRVLDTMVEGLELPEASS